MSSKESNTSGGIGFFGLLAIVFITLKLTHVIDWSWFWVLSPIFLPAIVVLIFVVIVGGIYLLIKLFSNNE